MLPQIELIPAGFLIIDRDGVIRDVNQYLAKMLGRSAESITGEMFDCICSRVTSIFFNTHIFPELSFHGFIEECYIILRRVDGAEIPLMLNGFKTHKDGEENFFFALMPMRNRHQLEQRINEAKKEAQNALLESERMRKLLAESNDQLTKKGRELASVNEKLGELTIRDPLTNVFNRRFFVGNLELELQRATATGNPISVLMIDIDHFKLVNDTFGHVTGDEAIRFVANVLGTCIRSPDTVSRYGGEEFAILLPGADQNGAKTVAERVRIAVEELNFPPTPLTISVGTATCLGKNIPPLEFIKLADLALYRAKQSGRNRTCQYEELTESSRSA